MSCWIRGFIHWASSRWKMRHLSVARRLAAEWELRANEAQNKLRRDRKRLVALQRQLQVISDTIVEDLDQAESVNNSQEAVVNALKEENQVMTKVLVPSLTAAHRLVLERYDAEIAIQARRAAAARTEPEM